MDGKRQGLFALLMAFQGGERSFLKKRCSLRIAGHLGVALIAALQGSCDSEHVLQPLRPETAVVSRRLQGIHSENLDSRVVELSLSPAQVSLTAGEALQLSSRVLNENGEAFVDPAGLTFSVADSSIVEVSDKGLIKAKSEGQAIVTADFRGARATSSITVVKSNAGTCDTFASFRDRIDPLLQTHCVSCHGTTGNVVAHLALPLKSPQADESGVRTNWDVIKSRVDMNSPAASRLITKATGVVPHGGGAVLKQDSSAVSVFEGWAQAEAACQKTVTITSLEIAPTSATVRQGATVVLQAMTKTGDGTVRNISDQVQWAVKTPAGVPMPSDRGSLAKTQDGVVLTILKAPEEWVVEATLNALQASAKILAIPQDPPPPSPQPECPSLSDFKNNVAPLLHASCGSCHHAGGFAAGAFAIVRDDQTCEALYENWQGARDRIDRKTVPSSVILGKPSGTLSHGGGAILATTGADYKKLAAWVNLDTQCRVKNPDDQGLEATMLCYKEALSLKITPDAPTLDVRSTLDLMVMATFADMTSGRPYDLITWQSSAPDVATVSPEGRVTGIQSGSAKIMAKSGKVSAEVTVTVRVPRTLVGIALTPTSQEVAAGEVAQYQVFNVFSDGEKVLRTTGVTWTTADATIAVPQSGGRILSKMPGSTTVKAVGDGCTVCIANATLRVTAPKPQSLAIEPNPALVTVGLPIRLQLYQVYTDGSKIYLNERATWTSNDRSVLDIDALGNAAGKMPGASDVEVTYSTFKVRTTVLVVSATGCSSLDMYKTKLDPMLQGNCMGCHKADGLGSGALTLKGPSPTADDVLFNWKEAKRRIDHPDPLRTSLMVKALNTTHPGSSLLQSTSANYKTLLDWVNVEVGCQVSSVPSSLARSSGKVLFNRLAALFPTAVSSGTDTKPLFEEEFDALRSQGSFRLVGQPERSLSPLAQVLWRGKVNALCKDFILGTPADELFKLTPELLLPGESSPADEALRLALTAARRAWLYPYATERPEVQELAKLYRDALALGGASPARTARQAVCIATLTAPQFLLGNAGEDDVVRRLALEVGGISPTMADFVSYRSATDKGDAARAYVRKLQSSAETRAAYMGRLSDWHRQWLGLRDFINGSFDTWSREASSWGGWQMATGIGGSKFNALASSVSGFPRTIEKGREPLNSREFDFSESCSTGVSQPFDPRTTGLIWEHWNPTTRTWEEVGRWSKESGSWVARGGQITLADGTRRATALQDIRLVTLLRNAAGASLNYYSSGNLKDTPVDGFDNSDAPGTRKRRVRRLSPSGEQNGYSTVRLWWSGEEVRVCNTVSRFMASCAYRPTKANPAAVPAVPNLDVIGSDTASWNAFDASRPKVAVGGRGSRDTFAHPRILESFRCGIPDVGMLAMANTPTYVESQAFPHGYANATDPIDPNLLNPVAISVNDVITFPSVPGGYRYGLTTAIIKANQNHANAKLEDKAFGRLVEDVTTEPLRLLDSIVTNNDDYRLMLTAPYTLGRAELDLYYRTQGYYLPTYPPDFQTSELGTVSAVRKIEYAQTPVLPLGWLKNSAGGYGPDQSELGEAIAAGGLKPRTMSGILTQTAFLAPVLNNGKTRSVSARVHERLLCGLPNEFVSGLDASALALHETFVSTKGATGGLHLDRTKGCYSCHVTLDPVASVFSKSFLTDPNPPGSSELRLAKVWNSRETGLYGLKGGGSPATGVFLGQRVEGVRSLGEAIANSKEFSRCVVKTAFENIFGRRPVGADVNFISTMAEKFRTRIDYNYNKLIEELVASPEFRAEN